MHLPENNDFLAHYGIKGQKWGVRRFQNEDRSLTAEGKERYGAQKTSFKEKVKRITVKAVDRATSAARRKTGIKEDISDLSDNDLQKRVNRMQIEANFRRLEKELNGGKSTDQGKHGKNGGKKHPYLAIALLTPVATAIGAGVKDLTTAKVKPKVDRIIEKWAQKSVQYIGKHAAK